MYECNYSSGVLHSFMHSINHSAIHNRRMNAEGTDSTSVMF